MTAADLSIIDDVRFFDGQRLEAADLKAIDTYNREMRWLHNRSMHQPGIGCGLRVMTTKGASLVTIQPGYAIDGMGREIVLTHDLEVPVPPVAGTSTPGEKPGAEYFALTLSYPTDAQLQQSITEVRLGTCGTGGAVRLREEPAVEWVPLQGPMDNLAAASNLTVEELRRSIKINLAHVGVVNCKVASIDLAVRASAKAPLTPAVGCGRVRFQESKWEHTQLGFQTIHSIDTSAAGFRTKPQYMARVEDANEHHSELSRAIYTTISPPTINIVRPEPRKCDAVVNVFHPTRSTGSGLESKEEALLNYANKFWSIVWIGVEGPA